MIALQVRGARREAGLSQTKLAELVVQAAADEGEEINLDRSAIAHWEAARYEPALRYRRFVARVLDRDIRTLFPNVAANEAA